VNPSKGGSFKISDNLDFRH